MRIPPGESSERLPQDVERRFQVLARFYQWKPDASRHSAPVAGAAVETTPKRTRRVFSAADKLRIVKKADACIASGERGTLEAMLREEGLYRSALSSWRGQLGKQGAAGF
jgi:hypothetical protein